MNAKRSVLLVLVLSFLFFRSTIAQTDSTGTLWVLDRLNSIGGCSTTVLPNRSNGAASEFPAIISTELGKAAYFDGTHTGILVKGSPLDATSKWTIEVLFKPDSSFDPENLEQRFLHIAQNAASSERLLFEIRLLKNQKWAFDLYLGCGRRRFVLLDTTHLATLHTVNQWHHVAVVYENPRVTTYIDGVRELSDTVSFTPPINAQTSIGARQDPRSWFKGTIRFIKATPRALNPPDFFYGTPPAESKH